MKKRAQYETFKDRISNGLQFYFRPKHNAQGQLYYQVDGYQNKVKLKLVSTTAEDKVGELENADWKISQDSIVSKEIKDLELDFNDAVSTEPGTHNSFNNQINKKPALENGSIVEG